MTEFNALTVRTAGSHGDFKEISPKVAEQILEQKGKLKTPANGELDEYERGIFKNELASSFFTSYGLELQWGREGEKEQITTLGQLAGITRDKDAENKFKKEMSAEGILIGSSPTGGTLSEWDKPKARALSNTLVEELLLAAGEKEGETVDSDGILSIAERKAFFRHFGKELAKADYYLYSKTGGETELTSVSQIIDNTDNGTDVDSVLRDILKEKRVTKGTKTETEKDVSKEQGGSDVLTVLRDKVLEGQEGKTGTGRTKDVVEAELKQAKAEIAQIINKLFPNAVDPDVALVISTLQEIDTSGLDKEVADALKTVIDSLTELKKKQDSLEAELKELNATEKK